MTSYGYSLYTFAFHHHGQPDKPLTLGELLHKPDTPEAQAVGWKNDALPILAAVLRGASQRREDKNRHLSITSVQGLGRSVRFTAQVGMSGQVSAFFDPDEMEDAPVFQRQDRHIEADERRGMFVVPANSPRGLLLLEAKGRATARDLITALVKRSVRHHTALITDFEAVVHEGALRQYLEQARLHAITLHRSGMPGDVADILEVGPQDREVARMKLTISPGSLKTFVRNLPDKFRQNDAARGALLRMKGLDFQELTIRLNDGQRQTTMLVNADRVPSFTYHLASGKEPPPDEVFYDALINTVTAVAPAMGAIVSPGWHSGGWSEEGTTLVLPVPGQEVSEDGTAPETQ